MGQALFLLAIGVGASADIVVSDPGPRGAPRGAGKSLDNLSGPSLAAAQDGQARFAENETLPGGLGPLYNSGPNGACSECHAQPTIGGSSASATAYPFVGPNPQATLDFNAGGAANLIPSFVSSAGPVMEMRLKFFRNPDGTLNRNAPDGGVHALFSVTGRSDAAGGTLAQPNFDREVAAGNAVFRIPIAVYGDGLVENIDDAAILANSAANAPAKAALGIHGHPNRSGNDGTVTRSGWKEQNKSVLMFSGEAYNVEAGVTNELFPTEGPEPAAGQTPPRKTSRIRK
jgi:Di-haem oxidoreductase, putative peroxidase